MPNAVDTALRLIATLSSSRVPRVSQACDGTGLALTVTGLVQGVGFRPFVHRLATEEGLTGNVANSPRGVEIAVFGSPAARTAFRARLLSETPPLARIDSVEDATVPGPSPEAFTIAESRGGAIRIAATPDAALCADCRRELFDPGDRRFRYPFLNCTNCGPRFSIVEGLPYDRATTTMHAFEMCAECAAEYADSTNRRFHAQPTACPNCGPQIWAESTGSDARVTGGEAALEAARRVLRDGGIVAVKGLGGFHLACDAANLEAIDLLRDRKLRRSKPFAVMVRDLNMAAQYCRVGVTEARLLRRPDAPIVLCDLPDDRRLPEALAPGLNRLGLMLPYTPLHALLLENRTTPLVMTSGNRTGEPQVNTDEAARAVLGAIADLFLMHDREIANRVDDSLVQVTGAGPQVLRRARGHAPAPVLLPEGFGPDHPPVLALGGDIKNAFALARGGQAIVSQHMGDLTSLAVDRDLDRQIALLSRLFDVAPALVAADPHPGYRSFAKARTLTQVHGVPLVEIAHHHAHAAACMAEHGLPRDHPAILALVLDGLGMGPDGTLWGAELLFCTYGDAERLATLTPAPLPGGDKAAQEPWRNLLARLDPLETPPAALFARLDGYPVAPLRRAMRAGLNAPPASSAGRLFDAVAAATGICVAQQDYEGEAAMRLQAAAETWLSRHGPVEGYAFAVHPEVPARIDPVPIWAALAEDPPELAAARFHAGFASAWADVTLRFAEERNVRTVVLTGGVFQNRLFAAIVTERLCATGIDVLQHCQVPAGDGGLALGQVCVALGRQRGG